jgi:hypothetical protein
MNRLLIVDDDTELCALLAERLAEDGFVLDAIHDGRKGLECAGSGGYSLVILDVMMPRMGGMDVGAAVPRPSLGIANDARQEQSRAIPSCRQSLSWETSPLYFWGRFIAFSLPWRPRPSEEPTSKRDRPESG